MRLTLRTMLAYVDDVLEPTDQVEIGDKIEESENATQQLKRARDLMRRTRIGAPPVMGRGFENDPNSVSAYLDNGLDPQRVNEFETICLESDVHMAEAAACHQILTLVLAEPATVDPTSRQRMYEIPAQVAAADRENSTQAAAAAVSTDGSVPDYIAKSQRARRRWLVVAGVAATVLVGLVGFSAWQLFGPESDVTDQTASASSAPTLDPTASTEPPAESPTETTSPPVAPDVDPSTSTTDHASAPDLPSATLPQLPATGNTADTGDLETDAELSERDTDISPPPQPGELASVDLVQPLTDEAPSPSDLEPDIEVPATPPATEENNPTEAPAAPAAESFGTFDAEDAVLCRLEQTDWMRMTSPTTLQPGDQLLALPSFVSSVSLRGGIELLIRGGTRITTVASEDGGVGLQVFGGRVVISQATAAPTTLQVFSAGHEPSITLVENQSLLAVEVVRSLPAGSDPLTATPEIQTIYYAAGGPVEWKHADAHHTLSPDSRWVWTSGGLRQVTSENPLPAWIEQEQQADEESRARLGVQQELSSERPISLSLLELSDHRRLEIRDLAARCAMFVGQFDPILKTFKDADQRIKRWERGFAALQARLAEGAEVAQQVQESCLRAGGEQGGAEVFRLLGGYSEAQLEAGADAELVELLSHQELEYRVLALCNLRAITGRAGLMVNFRPERTQEARRRALPIWQQRLERGKIRPPADE